MPNDIARLRSCLLKSALPFAAFAVCAVGSAVPAASAEAISQKDKNCLAKAIYFEARGESERGQKGVAQVVLNRVEDDAYPDTICQVVFQNQEKRNACQFSFACDGQSDRASESKAWKRAVNMAEEVLDGRDLIPQVMTATHYHADYVTPHWAPKMQRLSKIGRHIFYRT